MLQEDHDRWAPIVNAATIDPIHRESDYQELLQSILRVKHGRHFFNPAGASLACALAGWGSGDPVGFSVFAFSQKFFGEGTFLSLLSFLERYAPGPGTRRVTHLALADEARHVAFGMAHMEAVLAANVGLRARLATAVRRRHDALASTAGLNAEVFDALVVLAAGAFTPAAIAEGFEIVAVCPYVKGWVKKHPEYQEHVVPTTPDHLQALDRR